MRPRPAPPTIELHIDRVVLDGPHAAARYRDQLASGLTSELLAAITEAVTGARPDARPARVEKVALQMDALPLPDGEAAGRSLGRALAADLGPRLLPARKGAGR